jgi:hypothetical protein
VKGVKWWCRKVGASGLKLFSFEGQPFRLNSGGGLEEFGARPGVVRLHASEALHDGVDLFHVNGGRWW